MAQGPGFVRRIRGHVGKTSLITKRMMRVVLAMACVTVLALMPGCGGSGGGASASSGKGVAPVSSSGQPADASEATGAAFLQPKRVVEPEMADDAAGEPAICIDHVGEGYVTAQAESAARLKFQVRAGEQTYNYDLPNDGTQTVYPLNMGNGSYLFRIMQNTSGSNYVELLASEASVSLDSEFSPFLTPNMYCSYTADSACIEKARELTAQADNQAQAVQTVCEFVAAHVTYDNAKAEKLANSSGYVPNPDETLRTGAGICFDYASLSAAMLRSMGIPTRLMTGYVGSNEVYHAWIMVFVDGSWHAATFAVDPKTWSRCDVTFASTGSTQYVGDASAYTDKYMY